MRGQEEKHREWFNTNLARVIEAVPIEQVAAQFTELRPAGAERYIGRCPYPAHDDKSPSFTVYASRSDPHFNCFGIGCPAKGDVVNLWKEMNNLPSMDVAITDLAREYGVQLQEGRTKGWHDARPRREQLENALIESRGRTLQRRIFKWVIQPELLDSGLTHEEQTQEINDAWEHWWRHTNTRRHQTVVAQRIEKKLPEITDELLLMWVKIFCEDESNRRGEAA